MPLRTLDFVAKVIDRFAAAGKNVVTEREMSDAISLYIGAKEGVEPRYIAFMLRHGLIERVDGGYKIDRERLWGLV